jgi:hypothetical protein
MEMPSERIGDYAGNRDILLVIVWSIGGIDEKPICRKKAYCGKREDKKKQEQTTHCRSLRMLSWKVEAEHSYREPEMVGFR